MTSKIQTTKERRFLRPPNKTFGALALVALSSGLALSMSAGACIKRGYPLGSSGQVDIRVDVAGPLFAADLFDDKGKPVEPRQKPFSTLVTLFMTEGSEAAFGGMVEVRVEPGEALSIFTDPNEPADNPTCGLSEGSFRCRASEEGYAHFILASENDWSGEATIVVTWADQRQEHAVTVLPAGLPDNATNLTLITGGIGETSRVLATFLPLQCTSGPVPDSLGSNWREGQIRFRKAYVRATAPPASPGVVEHAPVIIEPLHPEAELSLTEDCTNRVPRLRVLLNATGESDPFYFCFSDIGGRIEFAVTSGQKVISPNPEIQVDAEPRLLRVRALKDTVNIGEVVDLFELSAYNAERVRIPMPVDLSSSAPAILPITQGSVTLTGEEGDVTIIQVIPESPGPASLHVTPRLLNQPDCASPTVNVVDPLSP